MIRVKVDDAADAARALYNAHSFIPAKSLVPYALISLYPDKIYTSGTDTYAAGTDYCPTTGYVGTESHALVARDDILALERCARKAAKATATVEVRPGSVKVDPMGYDAAEVPIYTDVRHLEIHHRIAALVSEAEQRPGAIPGVLALDPALWARFAKVKAGTGRIADLLMTSALEPVFIKIGPTFRGLVMPIDRRVYESNIGPEGLW